MLKKFAGQKLFWGLSIAFAFLVVFENIVIAQHETSADVIAKSNDPLSDLIGFTFDTYFAPQMYGTDQVANTMNIQGVVIPIRRHLRLRHIIRATLPIVTATAGPNEYNSGLGDSNIFDAFKLTPQGAKTEFAIGPLFVIPTATSDALGTGKWQAGAAIAIIRLIEGGSVAGGLITWQTDFAGDEDRPGTNLAVIQPNLALAVGRSGFYISSSPQWVFDFQNHRYLVPFSIGIGKVFTIGKTIVNVSAEPQITVYHRGEQQPSIQIFAQLNLQWDREPKK